MTPTVMRPPVPPRKVASTHREAELDDEEVRHQRDDEQEDGAGQGQAGHHEVQELGGVLAGTDAEDVAVVLLQVVGDTGPDGT